MRILVVNGPNLSRLGSREPEIYGHDTLAGIISRIEQRAAELGATIVPFQSNHEGAIIDFIQSEQDNAQGLIINPGAFGHYSYAIRDAISGSNLPTVEVHISNVHAREEFRHHSYLSAVATGVIVGLGVQGYLLALRYLAAAS